jgi:hypothetical protein
MKNALILATGIGLGTLFSFGARGSDFLPGATGLDASPGSTPARRPITTLGHWAHLDFPWPGASTQGRAQSPSRPGEKPFWAFSPVKVVPSPTVEDGGWANTPVDRYILATLAARRLKPAPRADKLTLLRRATFDLLGLPPTPEEIDAFLADESPQAFARVVDRLLASPHYGERWGRHWLDVVRYADSSGRVAEFKEIWRYRDWVTRAFNDDLPYTEFIRLQLAGDLLQPGDPKQVFADGLVATGMLAIAQFDPGSQKPQLHADSVDDMVDVVSRSFLGLTLACARCHDHKFDPFTTADYYGLAGIFCNVRVTTTLNMDPARVIIPLAPPVEAQRVEKQRLQLVALNKEIQKLRQQLKAKQKSGAEAQAKLNEKMQQLQELQKHPLPSLPRAVVVKEGGPTETLYKTFRDAPILRRGDPLKPGKVVPRGFPRALGGGPVPSLANSSGRLELAQWLTRPEHPLTARVMVNRLWQHHMGEGLVRTPNNFGRTGERPTHPELLDFLADYFVLSGWSVKAVHRLIMNSAVYQQSSLAAAATVARDPANRCWGRMNRRQLDAEALRDSLLAAAGTLDRSLGGPGTEDLRSPRRTHYYMTIRSATRPNGFNVLFERPDPALVCDQRSASTQATQALFLLNDPLVRAQARALAQRVHRELAAAGTEAKVRHLYRLALGRWPTAQEIAVGQELLRRQLPPGQDPWERYCHVLLCTNEFLFVD